MAELNHLNNGRFMHDLNNWVISGATYSAGDGDDHYGVAVLSTGGDYVEQTFSVPRFRSYTLNLAVKAVGADLSGAQATARITDGDGSTVVTTNLTGTADTWTENTITLGLAPGTTYTLRLSNASATGDVRIDDVWLWFVPVTRAEIAARVHAKLARLATDRSLSVSTDYEYAIDAGLRAIGAISPETGTPDTRYLSEEQINAVLNEVEREMLEQLQRDYATEVDLAVGPRREALSQIGAALSRLVGSGGIAAGTAGQIVQRRISYPTRKRYEQ